MNDFSYNRTKTCQFFVGLVTSRENECFLILRGNFCCFAFTAWYKRNNQFVRPEVFIKKDPKSPTFQFRLKYSTFKCLNTCKRSRCLLEAASR